MQSRSGVNPLQTCVTVLAQRPRAPRDTGGDGVRWRWSRRDEGRPRVIPAFRADRHLPNGVHETTPNEVEQRLVQVFPGSVTRADLFRGWRRRRGDVAAIAEFAMEWVDGSFVSLKQDPADVDVVTVTDGAVLDALDVATRQRYLDLFASPVRSKLAMGCDSYLLVMRPAGHPGHASYVLQEAYWQKWWSHTRTGVEKGYLDVRGDP
jgi:hypothetical protein